MLVRIPPRRGGILMRNPGLRGGNAREKLSRSGSLVPLGGNTTANSPALDAAGCVAPPRASAASPSSSRLASEPDPSLAWAARLPYGARPHTYWGRPYYAHGGFYYRPYTYRGVACYAYIPPPFFVYYPAPPVGAMSAYLSGLYANTPFHKMAEGFEVGDELSFCRGRLHRKPLPGGT